MLGLQEERAWFDEIKYKFRFGGWDDSLGFVFVFGFFFLFWLVFNKTKFGLMNRLFF
ncbi:hypothetical protein Syun_019030 [Stephania yunnanensis]|uniref:Uncharacterized protein n=1 Tax=Stephania yunnanensis TaxID=152371 RepID=A0AAP0IUZ8_9MAGN